jgi:hypothetical protein
LVALPLARGLRKIFSFLTQESVLPAGIKKGKAGRGNPDATFVTLGGIPKGEEKKGGG